MLAGAQTRQLTVLIGSAKKALISGFCGIAMMGSRRSIFYLDEDRHADYFSALLYSVMLMSSRFLTARCGDPALAGLERKAALAVDLLKLLANENRLLILCRLGDAGETTVGTLAEAVGLSQSALSQHLAKLREQRLVATRRDAQTIYYRLADTNAARVLTLLKDMFCP